VKLSPDFSETNEREIIPAALDAGVRIVNYGNTRKVANRQLSQGEGGLSGPDIFPTTLENLKRTRRVFGNDFEIISTAASTRPTRRSCCSTPAPRPSDISPDSSRAGRSSRA
jgi:hypothetical protein